MYLHKISVTKSEGNMLLEKPRNKLEDNIKIDNNLIARKIVK
jgi:hypothetical protein